MRRQSSILVPAPVHTLEDSSQLFSNPSESSPFSFIMTDQDQSVNSNSVQTEQGGSVIVATVTSPVITQLATEVAEQLLAALGRQSNPAPTPGK